jgi:hypothetical protein
MKRAAAQDAGNGGVDDARVEGRASGCDLEKRQRECP